jgi:O-antigen ligase
MTARSKREDPILGPMSTRTAWLSVGRYPVSSEAMRLWGFLVVTALAVIIAARISTIAFFVMAAVLLVVFAYVAFRSPRPMLVLMALAPLIDRYIVRATVPENLQVVGNMASEGLLVIVGVSILVHGYRTGRLMPALRHPMTLLMVAFVAVAIASALANRVSPAVGGLGIVFTVDAFALFFLARVIGFDERAAWIAAVAFVGFAVVAGILALGQVVLMPDLLGLTTWTGRFGEGLRPGSLFAAEPNMLGAVLAIALPFATFGVARPELGRKVRWICFVAAVILGVALIFTFSRGTWIALFIGIGIVGVVVERKALIFTTAIAAICLAIALALPRGILLPPGSQWSTDIANATLGRIDAISQGRDLRFKFMENALPILIDHPVIGSGPGTYGGGVAVHFGSPNYSRYTEGVAPVGQTVDNYWLHVLVEFGVVGALLLVTMLFLAVVEIVRAIRGASGRRRTLLAAVAASTIVLGVASTTEMLLEGNTTSFPLWFFIGVGSVLATEMVAHDGVLPNAAVATMPSESVPTSQA